MRIIIVDDEALGRLAVRQRLADLPDVEIVAECATGADAIEAIVRHAPDLMFLDVQMPGLSGFDVIERVGADAVPAVVFVTAFDRYALRAFETHAVDYLLKPVDPDRFRDAYARAARHVEREGRNKMAEQLEALVRAVGRGQPSRGAPPLERVVVKEGTRLQFIAVASIEWVEAAGNYVKLHVGSRQYVLRQTLQRMAVRLGVRFVRARRSALVNVEAIRSLEPYGKGSYTVLLRNGTQLISSRYAGRQLRTLFD